jgi:uncharacterized membrane protein YGL010W
MDTTSAQPGSGARRIDQLLAHYGTSHMHPANEVIHFIAIPLIMLSLIGLLFTVHPYLAYAFVLASMVYYARLSMLFLISMFVVSIAMLVRVQNMGEDRLDQCVGIFVVAWIFQFIGHKIEGKKPSFFEDIQYLWVGPLFVLSKLFIKLNIRW